MYCYQGNVGDSRAVASVSGRVIELSFDHKPSNELETKRIEAAGGWVEFNRVNGKHSLNHIVEILTCYLYIMGHKTTCQFICDLNCHISWWIFTLLVSMERGVNALQRSYKIYSFTLIVYLHYLIKTKKHKMAHFEVSCHSILLLNSKGVSMRHASCFLLAVR